MSAFGAHGLGNDAYAVRTQTVDIDNGRVTLRRVQDVEPILEDVKRRQSLGCTASKGPDNHWHAASFPAVVVERYCNTAGVTFAQFMEDDTHVKRMLRDPALSGFRVHTGRI